MPNETNVNIVSSCVYNVVFCTKYKRSVLNDAVADELRAIIADVAAENGFDVYDIKIFPNYVHLLMEVEPTFGVHRAIKRIKAKSSSALREDFPELKTKIPTLWTNAYLIRTCEAISDAAIDEFIAEQETSQRH